MENVNLTFWVKAISSAANFGSTRSASTSIDHKQRIKKSNFWPLDPLLALITRYYNVSITHDIIVSVLRCRALIRLGPSIKVVRKVLPIFDPLPGILASAMRTQYKFCVMDAYSASITQNLYRVVNFLRDSGHLISHFFYEWEICEVKNHQLQCIFILSGVMILTVIEQFNT